ncbi:MAG: NAD(P)H-dependent oxidoreductase subunit E, partial [Synergistaceae bacterium]|nr:NAD(P)H-dependent oxidoreductase subunit E [Synergistaceae bacterium]
MEKLARAHVLVCGGTGCTSSGSKFIIPALQEKLEARGMGSEIKVVETGCHGLCEMGPLVIVYPEGVFYVHVKPEDVDEIVETHLVKGRIIERLLYKEPATLSSIPSYDEIAFYRKQKRYALVNCGHINPESLEEYIGAEGYEGLGKALSMKPEQVVE